MQLLVSVRSADEAAAAVAGGAGIVDAKEPAAGALGAVPLETLQDICRVVAGARPVTAALGDAVDPRAVERQARAFAAAGAALLKVGFAGTRTAERAAVLIAAALEGTHAGSEGRSGVVVVAYADAPRADSLPPDVLLELAARAGAAGVLLDTADKAGPGLCRLLPSDQLAAWTGGAHRAGLLAALAGKLQPEDLARVRAAGADIAGVRGAACRAGRTSEVSVRKVQQLRALCEALPPPTVEARAPLAAWSPDLLPR